MTVLDFLPPIGAFLCGFAAGAWARTEDRREQKTSSRSQTSPLPELCIHCQCCEQHCNCSLNWTGSFVENSRHYCRWCQVEVRTPFQDLDETR